MHIGAVTLIGDVSPVDRESELQCLRSTDVGIGSPLGALLVGIKATLQSYELAFLTIGSLAFIALAIADIIKTTQTGQTP